jgi:TolB-like protein/Tfp pilus assembly protein PilF
MQGRIARWLAELRRRKVFRAGAVYVVVALGTIEAAESVLPALGVPAWVQRWIVIAAVAGLPIALVLAWALEWTPEGIRRAAPDEASDPATGASRPSARAPLIEAGLLAALVAGATWLVAGSLGGPGGPERSATEASIAIVPFRNLSGDPDHQYFADGLAEELLNELARLPGLKVAARTSSFAFRDSAVDIPTIARALNVATILDGSARGDENRLIVSVQLVSADGFTLWSEEYERPPADVFRVQDEIAREISSALGVRLLPDADGRATRSGDRIVEAHNSYLRGRQALGERTSSSIREALRHFQRAVDQDPDYAAAHAGLAQAYYLLPLYAEAVETAPMAANAKAAAREAIRLDSLSAEAWAALGGVAYQIDWDMATAEAMLTRAIRIAPSYATAHQWLAETFASTGRFDRARESIGRARELDPVSPVISLMEGFIVWYAGDLQGADAAFRRVFDLDENFEFALFNYPDLLLQLEEFDLAGRIADRAAPLYFADDPDAARAWRHGVDLLARALQDPAWRPAAVEHWRTQVARTDLFWTASALAQLGDVDGTLMALRKMRDRRDLSFVWTRAKLRWHPRITEDPRYRRLMESTGLPVLDAPETATAPSPP